MISRIRIALLTSVVVAAALCPIRADDKPDDKDKDKKEPVPEKKEPLPAPVPAPGPGGPAGPGCCGGGGGACGPQYQTICVQEWVPEYYKTTRTTYKRECVPETYTAYRTECVPETYTAYRTECVPETRTRQVTHYERVCETRQVCKTVCERVCVPETRTVMKAHWTCVPVTTYTCRTVDKGHWECREVPCDTGCGGGGGFLSHFRGGRGRGHGGDDCCNPCPEACCPPPTKTVRVWVSCKVTEQVPCTRMERKCEMVPECVTVNVWKSVPKTITCNETFWKCVPVCKTETYTCMVSRCVPYQATRNVARCVPYQATRMVSRCVPCTEEVTACRMVCRTVQKQVPVCPPAPCNECCETACCKPSLRDRLHSMAGRFGRHKGGDCGCESSCGCGGGFGGGGCCH
jgi:hypothetical protein